MKRMELWERRRRLGEQVLSKRRLFLDVRFWNDLCDAEGGKAGDCEAVLLTALRKAVTDGRLVCPVEIHLVEELHRQSIPEKRSTTLALVDELSSKALLLSAPERVFLEVLRFVQSLIRGQISKERPSDEMWTRPAYAAGHYDPSLEAPGIPEAIATELRRSFDEEWWNFGFVDLFSGVGIPPFDGNAKHHTADLLNAAKDDPTTRLKSLEATYWSEVRGTLDAFLPQLGEVWKYLFFRSGGNPESITDDQLQQASAFLRTALYRAAKKPGVRQSIPSLHVGARLYSHLQWDAKRRYKPNDVFDFSHAEAALPYADAFATDGALANLIVQSGLSKDYPCAVLTSANQVVDWVEAIAAE